MGVEVICSVHLCLPTFANQLQHHIPAISKHRVVLFSHQPWVLLCSEQTLVNLVFFVLLLHLMQLRFYVCFSCLVALKPKLQCNSVLEHWVTLIHLLPMVFTSLFLNLIFLWLNRVLLLDQFLNTMRHWGCMTHCVAHHTHLTKRIWQSEQWVLVFEPSHSLLMVDLLNLSDKLSQVRSHLVHLDLIDTESYCYLPMLL